MAIEAPETGPATMAGGVISILALRVSRFSA